MEEFKKYLAKVIKMLTRHTAILACGAASFFGGYQTKRTQEHLQEVNIKRFAYETITTYGSNSFMQEEN